MIVDYLDDTLVVWLYPRSQDADDAASLEYRNEVLDILCAAFEVAPDDVFFKFRKIQRGLATQYEKLARKNVTKIVKESGLRFELNVSDYLDTGLFLDHRPMRTMVRDLAKGKRLLNLFAYTGSFTCYAISGGAVASETVDISNKYSDWSRRNFALNGVRESAAHRILTQDCLAYLEDPVSRDYDIIVCDPPTFSNSKKMAKSMFSVDEDYPALIAGCLKRLSETGVLFFSTNSRKFRMDESRLPGGLYIKDITGRSVPKDFEGSGIHRAWRIERLQHKNSCR